MTNNDVIFDREILENGDVIWYGCIDVNPSEYLKWLDYACLRDVVLTKEESELLRKEFEVKKIIEKYTRKEMLSEEEKNLMESYMRTFSILRLAEIKLTEDQMELCENRVCTISDNISSVVEDPADVIAEFQKSIKMFSASPSIVDNYICYLLRVLKADFICSLRKWVGREAHRLLMELSKDENKVNNDATEKSDSGPSLVKKK